LDLVELKFSPVVLLFLNVFIAVFLTGLLFCSCIMPSTCNIWIWL